jgi:hypothetical protein
MKLLLKPGIRPGRALKRKFICVGGPLDKHYLYLESGSTLPLNFNGVHGRYVEHGVMTIKWETK